jgi:lysophospholipase L1-like esterase
VKKSHPKRDEPFENYTAPKIDNKRVYTIVMIGDSMTHALGPHGGKFSEEINKLYKAVGHEVIIDNYASGSTNILSLDKAMNSKTTYWDSKFEPLLSREFDMILVESFGYNPLSQYGLEEGLKKQNEELDKLIKELIEKRPNAVVIFAATIAPNKNFYSRPVDPNKPQNEREELVEERNAYIKNHIEFAKDHNIPLINIFEKSLNSEGDGDLMYINPTDYIHPSAVGIEFISQELSNFIYINKILPW